MRRSKGTQRKVLVVVSLGRNTEGEGGHAWSPCEISSYFHTAAPGPEVCFKSSLQTDREVGVEGEA